MQNKVCTKCKVEKAIKDFHKDSSRVDGLANKCKQCRCKHYNLESKNCRACGDLFYLNNLAKAQVYCGSVCQRSFLMYGISEYKIEDLLISQDYKCGICKVDIQNKYNIDHCHNTGHVRGLLCTQCNSAIGLLRDNVSILNSAINYLNAFESIKPNEVNSMFTGSVRYRRKRGSFNAKTEYKDI
jgi:hypothetical protein